MPTAPSNLIRLKLRRRAFYTLVTITAEVLSSLAEAKAMKQVAWSAYGRLTNPAQSFLRIEREFL
jgi:hypothetical protein